MFQRQPPATTLPDSAKAVFRGQFYSIMQWPQKMYDGSEAIFEVVKRPDTVDIIAVTEDKKIIITRQEQPALKPFVGLPGGMMDEGETAEEAARRELLEETGYTTSGFRAWYIHQPMGRVDWCCYSLIADNCKKVAEPTPDAGEKIQLELLDFDSFVKLVFDPGFRDKNVAYEILRRRGDDLTWSELKGDLGISA